MGTDRLPTLREYMEAATEAEWEQFTSDLAAAIKDHKLPPLPSGPVGEYGTVDDGFGGEWLRCKADCGLQVVRPGKVQCECDRQVPV